MDVQLLLPVDLLEMHEKRIAESLIAIRGQRLWDEFDSFEEYCRERWNMKIAPSQGGPFPMTGGIYFVQPEGRDVVKIGVAREFENRIAALQTSSPERLNVLGVMFGHGFAEERLLHSRFADKWINGEWFRLDRELREFVKQTLCDLPRMKPGKLTWAHVIESMIAQVERQMLGASRVKPEGAGEVLAAIAAAKKSFLKYVETVEKA